MNISFTPSRQYLIVFGFVLLLLSAGCTLPGGSSSSGCSTANETVCGTNGQTYLNSCYATAAGVQTAHDGACTSSNGGSSSCTDSDGGKDTYTAGSISRGSASHDDSCVDTSSVKEYYCDSDEIAYAELPCGSGYACTNGACVVAPCSDTDGGAVSATAGTTTSGTTSKADSCDGTSVLEYYCSDGTILSKSMDCGTGKHCVSGACAAYACTDSDSGQDTAEAGTTTLGATEKEDSCSSDGTKVTEYYCDDSGAIKSTSIACGSGETCKSGECVEITCTDSDSGQTKGTKGTTALGTKSYTDSCYSTTTVLEYYCKDGAISYATLACGSGYACSGGVCVESECDEEDLDGDDVWYEFKSASSITLYEGERAGIGDIDDQYYVELDSITEASDEDDDDTATFVLYQEGDEICDDEEIADGDDTSDLCDEGLALEVTAIDVDEGTATIESSDDVFYLQIYSQEGTAYSGSGCTDEDDIESETSNFYPRLASGTVKMLGTSFKVSAVDADDETVTMKIDGDSVEIDDGDEVEINDVDYTFSFDFSDNGLTQWTLES